MHTFTKRSKHYMAQEMWHYTAYQNISTSTKVKQDEGEPERPKSPAERQKLTSIGNEQTDKNR